MSASIAVVDISRSFPGRSKTPVVALSRVTFEAAPGRITGLIGPNGAGKTTLFRLIAGLLRPDSGSVSVGGRDPASQPREARALLGLLTEEPGLPERLTPLWHVSLHATLHGLARDEAVRRAERLLCELGLEAAMMQRHARLSRGTRLKVALARALVHDPSALLLDEPMAGLDMGSAAWMREIIRKRADRGCAVLMATHNPIDGECLCDDLVILGPGRLLAAGSVSAVCRLGAAEPRLVVRLSTPAVEVLEAVRRLPGIGVVTASDDRLYFAGAAGRDAGLLATELRAAIGGVAIREIGEEPASLEQTYHRLQQGRE